MQNTPSGLSTRAACLTAPSKSSMSISDMHATAKLNAPSANGSAAASASVTGTGGDPDLAARTSVGERSTPTTRRPSA